MSKELSSSDGEDQQERPRRNRATVVAPPPQLHFDDGSRVIAAECTTSSSLNCDGEETIISGRGSIPIDVYYEIDRLSKELVAMRDQKQNTHEKENYENENDDNIDNFYRVALQFPDNLLRDAPELCWAMEEVLLPHGDFFLFVLGDTTFGACCPDEVNALHLCADVIIHYGHACLSPSLQLPVLYSFGISSLSGKNMDDCMNCIQKQIENESEGNIKILLLYQVQYYHAMDELQRLIMNNSNSGDDNNSDISVIMGQIPSFEDEDDESSCCETPTTAKRKKKVAGLEIPSDLDLSTVTVLYIGSGDIETNKQYVNMMMEFVSSSDDQPVGYWTYDPATNEFDSVPNRMIRRQLNRRFYLIQKARDATTFGILVGTLSQKHFTRAVSYLQSVITAADRACYTFAVGKLNPAKLANFGEIDAYILVACPEHSLLSDDRDFHVPVITPLELDICLGNTDWGAYSLDYNAFLNIVHDRTTAAADITKKMAEVDTVDDEENKDDDDTPYFSLVTGTLQDSRKLTQKKKDVDLLALPGQGQLIMHHSSGAEYLKQREFQGLETQLGKTEVHAAKEGLKGIASHYQ